MAFSRVATALAGLTLTLAFSALLWVVFDTPLFFVAVPFVPFLFRSRADEQRQPPRRTCPRCSFDTRDPDYQFCPRDGTKLE